MLTVAQPHGLNEFVVKAERALEDVTKVVAPLAATSRSDVGARTAQIEIIAKSLARLRAHTGL
jgi:hypothetical protein